MRRPSFMIPCLTLLLSACDAVDSIRHRVSGATPRESYMNALSDAGLLETALGRDWVDAGDAALRQPLTADVPVEETGYLDAAEPRAVAVRLRLQRGQRVTIRADLLPAADALLFLDVFRLDTAETATPRFLAAADSGGRWLEFEPNRTGDHIVRLQTELLRGGRYTLTVRSTPALSFPVHGVGSRAIGSRFGAPRDAGARQHHGIDIFAPRGTPVIAAAPGVVNRVQETPVGGRVVWLRDERRAISLYYAHLDEQLVTSGMRVDIGDTLGTVGNTGNARTTPPHLHFGIYRRGEGPIDPLPYVYQYGNTVPRLRADTTLFGRWARTTAAVSVDGRRLEPHTPVRLRGAAADRYRAELPDRTLVWLAASNVERVDAPVTTARTATRCNVRDRPTPNSAVITQLRRATSVAVLGRFGQFRFVRADSVFGWTDCA